MQETVIKNQRIAQPVAKELDIADKIKEMANHKITEFAKDKELEGISSSEEEEEE
jgi:hypothetical protein